eukprot:COSAG04_NODE_74_length_28941_cov_11.557971_21_plen_236_part_00
MESAGDEGSGGEESGDELEALQAELSEMMGAEDAEPEQEQQELQQPGGAEAKVEEQIREASATVAAVLSATAATVQALTAVERAYESAAGFDLAREEEQQQEQVQEQVQEEDDDEGEEKEEEHVHEDEDEEEEFESLQALMELVCADDDDAPADGRVPSSAVDTELSAGFLLKRAPPAAVDAVEDADARTFVAAQERPFREVILEVSVRGASALSPMTFHARPLTHGGAARSREG